MTSPKDNRATLRDVIGMNPQFIREMQGLNVADAATAIGVDADDLARWESGAALPNLRQVALLQAWIAKTRAPLTGWPEPD